MKSNYQDHSMCKPLLNNFFLFITLLLLVLFRDTHFEVKELLVQSIHVNHQMLILIISHGLTGCNVWFIIPSCVRRLEGHDPVRVIGVFRKDVLAGFTEMHVESLRPRIPLQKKSFGRWRRSHLVNVSAFLRLFTRAFSNKRHKISLFLMSFCFIEDLSLNISFHCVKFLHLCKIEMPTH